MIYSVISTVIFSAMLGYYTHSFLRTIGVKAYSSKSITSGFLMLGVFNSYVKFTQRKNELNLKYTPIYLQSIGRMGR